MAEYPAVTKVRSKPPLQILSEPLDMWLASVVDPYLAKTPSPSTTNATKEIHDPVVGRISLSKYEVFILDSPLLQRLRYIRQLGVAHFLFPTTGYSRFEHTIGARGRAVEMLEALRSRNKPETPPVSRTDHSYEAALKLGALFHDVGHCAFSHVSEKFYGPQSDIQNAITFLNEFMMIDGEISPSELISILIVTSPVVRKLLDASRIPINHSDLEGDKLQNFVVCCIAGSSEATAPNSYLAQIINGPIDCDKLDYLARDAHMAGTPIALDVGRLVSKLRLAPIKHKKTGATTYSLGIDISGARAVDELLASRVFLFDKLYFHHKVLAAEELLRQGLETLKSKFPVIQNPITLLPFSDEQLLDLYPLKDIAHLDPSEPEFEVARDLFARVRYRQLPKRVFAFAMRFLDRAPKYLSRFSVPGKKADIRRGKAAADEFIRELEKSADNRRLFAQQIISGCPTYNGNVYVAIPKPTRVAATAKIAAVDADGETIDDRGDAATIDFIFAANKWVEAYAANKLTGFVFADSSNEEVYLSTERILLEKGISFGNRAWTMGKMSRARINELRAIATAEESEDRDTWLPCRLAPDFLELPETKQQITKVAKIFHPMHADVRLSAEQWVHAWLFQFPDPDLQQSALALLRNVKVLSRDHRASLFKEFMDSGDANGAWTIFAQLSGDRKKSSDLIGYFTKDLGKDAPPMKSLDEWSSDEITERNGIVFLDDVLATGTQATTLLSSWFGVSEGVLSQRDADEELPVELKNELRNVPVTFYFLVAWSNGVRALQEACVRLGIKATIRYGREGDDQSFTISGVEFHSEASENRFMNFLQAKGEELLATREFTLEQKKAFALGYEGLRATLAFSYSTPTGTITALWESFEDDKAPWLPIVPRYPVQIASRIKTKPTSSEPSE